MIYSPTSQAAGLVLCQLQFGRVWKSRVLGSQGRRGELATARCSALLCASAVHNSACQPVGQESQV